MKYISIYLSFVIGILFIACSDHGISNEFFTAEIQLIGKKTDTTFLNGDYKDEGAYLIYHKNERSFRDEIKGKGSVNTASLGTYYIDYDFTDSLGNHSATVTRTVHVIEHRYTYLNGLYDVACSCTITSNESGKTELLASTYTAEVSSSSNKDDILIKYLRVGPEDLQPYTTLIGDTIIMNYYSRDLQSSNGNNGKGYLMPDKNSFVVFSLARPYAAKKTYQCKNVFTKKLIMHPSSSHTNN